MGALGTRRQRHYFHLLSALAVRTVRAELVPIARPTLRAPQRRRVRLLSLALAHAPSLGVHLIRPKKPILEVLRDIALVKIIDAAVAYVRPSIAIRYEAAWAAIGVHMQRP